MSIYKQNTITKIPVYNDGIFELFKICQKKINGTYPQEYIKSTKKKIWYELLSISDKLKFEAEERNKNITYKVRIPQMTEITSLHVVKIEDKYHKVFNAYHFTNKDGFKQTDLTLEEYPRVVLEEEINE